MDETTLTLNSPITEEQWDTMTDVDFRRTNEIIFITKHGKEVKFVKASAQTEVIRCKDCVSYGEMLAGRDTRMICHKFALNFPQDFYCADAERRTDE